MSQSNVISASIWITVHIFLANVCWDNTFQKIILDFLEGTFSDIFQEDDDMIQANGTPCL